MLGFKTIEQMTLNECEEYLNRTDISEEERNRAEQRMSELISITATTHEESFSVSSPVYKESIVEKFPEYGFTPVSLIPGASKHPAIQLKIGLCLLPIVFVSIPFIVMGVYAKKHGNALIDVADYIATEKICGFCRFFIKNKKFGVLGQCNSIIIPAEYDKLSWWKGNQILEAVKDGRRFLIDIKGNELD